MSRELIIRIVAGLVSGGTIELAKRVKGPEMAEALANYWPWLGAVMVFFVVWLIQAIAGLIQTTKRIERALGGGIFVEPEREGAKRWEFKEIEEMTPDQREKKLAGKPDMVEWYRMEEWWHRRISMAQRTGKKQAK
jgi:hypothetical protein